MRKTYLVTERPINGMSPSTTVSVQADSFELDRGSAVFKIAEEVIGFFSAPLSVMQFDMPA